MAVAALRPVWQVGSFSMTFGGRTFSIDFNYTARIARLLEQEISLADTNVVLVDDVDGPSGAYIVGRLRVDPKLPEADRSGVRTIEDDPAITAIRRSPEAGTFLQCDVPLPMPTGAGAAALDPTVRARLNEVHAGSIDADLSCGHQSVTSVHGGPTSCNLDHESVLIGFRLSTRPI